MIKKRLALQYAKTFCETFKEDLEGNLYKLELLNEAFSSTIKYKKFFENPSIPKNEKLRILKSISDKLNGSEKFFHFLKVLEENKRIALIPYLIKELKEMVDKKQGKIRGFLLSSYEIDEASKKELEALLSKILKYSVILSFVKDPSISYGFKIRVGTKVFDATIDSALKNLKEYLLKR